MADNYFNFPVQLMKIAPNIRQFCNDVIDYCIYSHSRKLNGRDSISDAAEYFGVLLGSTFSTEANGRRLYHKIPLPAPMTGISKGLLFDFLQDYKTEQEIAVLMAFLAI